MTNESSFLIHEWIEDVKLEGKRHDEKEKKTTARRNSRVIKDVNSRIEKTTLGELDVLSALKKKMEAAKKADECSSKR